MSFHAVFDGTHIHLWSEGVRAPHKGGSTVPPPHPYAEPPAQLWQRLPRESRRFRLELRALDVMLPSDSSGPIPCSEPLVDACMRWWRIPTVAAELVSAVPLLARLPRGQHHAETEVWAAAARWVLSLLARESVVPTVERDGMRHDTRWLPLLDDLEYERLEALAAALPQAGWKSAATAREALTGFVEAACTAMAAASHTYHRVRADAAGHPLIDAWTSDLSRWRPQGHHWHDSQKLSDLLRAWTLPLLEGPPAHLRLRLVPPRDAGAWTVDVMLVTEHADVEMFAADAWGDNLRTTPWGAHTRRLASTRERLLHAAAEHFPALRRALAGDIPRSVELDEDEVVTFLESEAPALQAAGLTVLIPAHLRPAHLSAEVSPRFGDSGIGRQALLDFDWRISLGDARIDAAAFLQAVEAKRRLFRLGQHFVILDLEKAARLAKAILSPGRRLSDALRIALDETLEVGLDLDRVVGGGGASAEVEALPRSFQGVLRPYQQRGVVWLRQMRRLGLGACLADDMGLGKTIQVIALLLGDRERGEHGPVLLVCPTSVVGNWQREIERFGPSLKTHIHHGSARQRGAMPEVDVVVTTYGLIARDEFLGQVEWRGVVLDEAQNVKNADTAQARAVRRLRAGFRLVLSGTPVENRLSDLWSLFEFLNPSLLGGRESFQRRYAVPIERQGDKERLRRLRQGIAPLILRRVKTDPTVISDLPEKQEMKTWCPLTVEQAVLYKAVVEKMLEEVPAEAMKRRAHILTAMLRLKQVCNHPAHLQGDGSELAHRSGKLARVEDLLAEVVEAGERALVFTQFAEWGERLQGHLRARLGCEVLWLHGGTPRKQRDAMVARFNALAAPAVFVLSLKAGGSGLNLIGANHVFHYDRWWNPAVENQATDRAFRIGQMRNVQVHKMISLGTLEETIDALIERKTELAEGVLGTGEGWLTELSTDDLRQLLTLREDLVEDDV